MRFKWKTWSGLCAAVVGLMAVAAFSPAPAMAATLDVATLAELTSTLASAADGDTIRLTGNIALSDDYTFATGTRNLTIDTNGKQLTVGSGYDDPLKTGTGTLTFVNSSSTGEKNNLAFDGFNSIAGTIVVQTGTGATRTITSTDDVTEVDNGGSLEIKHSGNVWDTMGDISAAQAAGTTGDVKFIGESSAGPKVTAGTLSLADEGTGTLTVEKATVSLDRLELGLNGGYGNIVVKDAGTLNFDSSGGVITYTDSNGNGGLYIKALAIGANGTDITVDNGVLRIEDGGSTGGVFAWDTQTTTIDVTNGGFLNFMNGLTADFTNTSIQNGVSMDNASFIWIGTQYNSGTVDIKAETVFTTTTDTVFEMKNGSTFYSTDTMTFTADAGASFSFNISGTSDDNVSAYFGTFGDLNLNGDGDYRISVTDGGSFSAGETWTMTLKGSTFDDPEIYAEGAGSYIGAGKLDFAVTGDAYIVIRDVGGMEIGGDATFTTDANGILNLDLSGTGEINGTTYGSYLSVDGDLTITGDGKVFISLVDGGQIYAGGEFNLDLVGSNADNAEIVISGLNSYISAGTGNITTTGTSYFDISGGGGYYSSGNTTLTMNGAGTAYHLNISGTGTASDDTESPSFFEIGGDLKIEGDGDVYVELTDGAAMNIGGKMTIDVDGENTIAISGGSQMSVTGELKMTFNGSDPDNPEISITGEKSYLLVGGAKIDTEGAAYIKVDDLGAFYSSAETTFTATGAGSSFTFDITGSNDTTGSAFETDGNLNLAGDGTFTVNLTDGGYMYIGYNTASDLTVDGAALADFNIGKDSALVVTGNFTVTNVDTNIVVDGTGAYMQVGDTLSLGTSGDASLDVTNGGTLETGSAILGAGSGTTVANVTGLGDDDDETSSSWLNSGDLVVGDKSNAELNITDGGYVGYDSSAGSLNLIVGREVTADNSVVNVSSPDPEIAAWLEFHSATIGDAGVGTLNIFTSGEVFGSNLTLGSKSDSFGTVNVSGEHALLNLDGAVVIGSAGTGEINLDDEAVMYGGSLTLGEKRAGIGSLNLDGEDTAAIFSGAAVVGALGTGTITMTGESVFQAASMTLGAGSTTNSTASGTVDIAGGEMWISTSDAYGALVIGDYGTGSMNIRSTLTSGGKVDDKGIVYAGAVTLGNNSGSTGTLTLTDKGYLTASGLLTAGSTGTATIELSGGSQLTAAGAVVGVNKKSTDNVISLTGAGTEMILTAASADIALGAGTGTLTISDQAKMTIQAGSYFTMNGNATVESGAELRMESTFGSSSTTWSYLYLGDENRLTVRNSGKLTGNGVIWVRSSEDDDDTGSVVITNGGILAPGDSTTKTVGDNYGYLYIDGDLNINNGGIYAADLGTGGYSDYVEVSGFADLNGGVIQVKIIENITDNTEWVILKTYNNEDEDADGITGDWTLDTDGLPAFVSIKEKVLDGTGGEEDHSKLTLMVERSEYFNAKGDNANSRAVGEALDAVPLAQWYLELEKLSKGTEAELNDAMRQMSGSIHGNAMFLARQQLWYPIAERVSWTPDGRAYLGPQHPYHVGLRNRSTVWLHTNYNYTKVDGSRGLDGFRVDTFNILVGLDTIFEDNLAGGVYAGFSAPRLKQDDDRAEADSFTAGIHAGYKFMGGFEVKGMLAYTYHTFYSDRNLNFFNGDHYHASAKYNGTTLTASVEFARPFYFGCMTLRPLFAVDMEYVWMEDVIESGAGLYNLKFSKSNSSWTFARLGANFDISPALWERFNLKGRLFYTVQMDKPDTSFNAMFVNSKTGMHITGTDPGRHFFNAGVTANYAMGVQQRASLYANYDMYVGGRSNSHMVGFGFQFLY